MASPTVPVPLSIFHNTVGAIVIGNTAAATLFGITTSQVYMYYQWAAADGRFLKCLIFFLWILDATQQALYTTALYKYSMTGYLDASALARATPSREIGISAVISGTSDLVVRCIFSSRLWKFSGKSSLPIVVVIVVLSVIVVAGDATMTGFIYSGVDAWLDFDANYSWVLYTTFGCGASADIILAVSLSIALWTRRTISTRTNSLLRTLMVYTINTGALTSITALVSILTYATMPRSFVFLTLLFVLPKLLFNAVLANLNARSSLREAYLDASGHVSIRLSELTHSDGTRATPDTSQLMQKRNRGAPMDTDRESAETSK